MSDLESFTRSMYPVLPQGAQSFRAALAGAENLGLVLIQGRNARQTFVGAAAAELLPDSATLATHLARRGTMSTLAALNPAAGAVLRWLLMMHPATQFLIETLLSVGVEQPLTMHALVVLVAERDRTLTPTIFFKPEAIAEITDDQGRLVWRNIRADHFRGTTFMQIKSILKHAGVIAPHPLSTSTRTYDPDRDLWEVI